METRVSLKYFVNGCRSLKIRGTGEFPKGIPKPGNKNSMKF